MEVDVRPAMNAQSTPISPSSPKKRLYDEMNDSSTTPNPSEIRAHADDSPMMDNNPEKINLPSSNPPTHTAPEDNVEFPSLSAPSQSPSTGIQPTISDSVAAEPLANTLHPSVFVEIPVKFTSPSTPNPIIQPTPNKKRKLSPASKDARDRQKSEEKAKKEEERKLKEEEKRKRDEEREVKRRKKEEERQAKEDEKKRKEEEKQGEKKKREEERLKKEKPSQSQMKLNAFFAKPKASATKAIEPSAAEDASNSTPEVEAVEQKPISDYERDFPPFFVRSSVQMGPSHRFERDEHAIKYACEKLDAIQHANAGEADSESKPTFNPSTLFNMISYKRRQGKTNIPSVKDILLTLQDPNCNYVDLTGPKDTIALTTESEKKLRKVPMKILQFQEDVRPPYQGTFTKKMPAQTARRLCRNPFLHSIPDFNYDYDSEAEWEEPEEGEDLGSEVDDEPSEDGEDDMDDFLDDGDEDGGPGKRRMVAGDLEPQCTGICWAEETVNDPVIAQHRMEIMSVPSRPSNPKLAADSSSGTIAGPTQIFLSSNRPLNLSLGMMNFKSNPRVANPMGGPNPSQKPRIPFPEDQIPEFKAVISGSDLTKTGLIEVLKKRFPKVSKDTLKDTLSVMAVRQGQKEVDKRWVLR
ncbi:hypothetical protein FQN57_002066 [Myotisia sp. PD_48]|nr:hypothetical protein FQN57_002066 [Myotisia sp. PD_48]